VGGRSAWLRLVAAAALACAGAATTRASAQESDAEALAKQLSNPVANLVSVPLQLNYDQDIGPDDGERVTLNIQPVAPFSIGENWNVISRTILPVTWQDDVVPGEGDQFGLGDTTQSLFFSPKSPTAGGLIWGAGPAFLLPTATDDLGAEKWGIGPTAVVLRQTGAWTYGILANHIWSFAGDDDRGDISSTFLQPFLAHTTKDAWTYTVNLESTYDWEAEEWAVPVNALVSKLLVVGSQRISLGAGVRYWLNEADNGPEGFGARAVLTFLFPK
jgi:hypothetical protein